MTNSQSKLLITGSNGLLGQKIVKLCSESGIDFLAVSSGDNRNPQLEERYYKQIDVTNHFAMNQLLDDYSPTCIINTAAMTNVDLCESLVEECYDVNAEAVKNLFNWTEKNEIQLIQISTDFIFDGEKDEYTELDSPNPLSIYGASKNKAEEYLMESEYLNWTIIRTSLVYGAAFHLKRSNIVLWAREEILRNRSVKIVDDQFRAPTWANDLAHAVMSACLNKKNGVFNIVGKEYLSMFEFVKRIVLFYKQPLELVSRIKSSELQQAAKRPVKTNMIIEKAKIELGYEPHSIENTLSTLEQELPLYSID
jgi:dTDP-4-dehydrorhamnose reductase